MIAMDRKNVVRPMAFVGFQCPKCKRDISVYYHLDEAHAEKYAWIMVREDFDNHCACCGDKWREDVK